MDMLEHNKMMRMVRAEHFDVPTKASLEMIATGKHVMLMDLNGPLQVGETFMMVLEFANAGEVEVGVSVIEGTLSGRPGRKN